MALSDQIMDGSPTDRLVYTCLLAGGLIVLVNRRRQVGRVLRANGPILLFFLYCAVSLFWSDYPDVAFKRWTKALGDLIMVLVVLTDREPYDAINRLLARTSYILIPLSILFIKYYPDLGRGYGYWQGEVHYTGVTLNKNTLGVICLVFGLGSVWRFLAAYRSRKEWARTQQLITHIAILAMVLWLFRITNSMTSLSCFLLAGALLFAASFPAVVRRPAVLHLLVASAIIVPFATLFWGVGAGLAQSAMDRNITTLTDRTGVWQLALSLTANPFFGAGFESFWLGPRLEKIWSVYSWKPLEAHNGYIEVFLNLGWTGVSLLAVVLATAYRTVLVVCRRNMPTGNLMLAFFVVGVVYNFTEAAFFRMMAPAWIFFLLAITSAPEVSRRKNRLSTKELLKDNTPLTCERAHSTLTEDVI